MNGTLVVVLTAIPILLGTAVGYRRGGSSTLASVGRTLLSWALGIGLAAFGLRQGWLWPAGLITPVLYGLLLAIVVRWVLSRRAAKNRNESSKKNSEQLQQLSKLQHTSGATLGALLGLICAIAGWQVALFADCLATPLPSATALRLPSPAPPTANSLQPNGPISPVAASFKSAQSPWSALVDVAQKGFIKHLPVAGPMSEDLLAIASIMKTSPEIRKDYARHKGWDSLAQLPSLQAIAEDDALFADIDAAISGNLLALYRLQKHPLMIDFSREASLQKMVSELKARQIASELEEFRNQKPFAAWIPADFHF